MRRVLALLIVLCLGLFGGLSLIFPPALQAAPPVQQGTQAVISAPQSLATVRGNVVIQGSATHPDFWKYEVHYGAEPNPAEWVLIGTIHESAVVNGRLETWNTGLVPDGTYSLRLRVARRDGNYDEYYVRQIRVANAGPTETPTPNPSAETPTPTITPTPMPATATIVIEQPKRATATPDGSPTAEASEEREPTATPSDKPTISGKALLDSFCSGGKLIMLVFAGFGFLALVRGGAAKLVRWGLRKVRRHDESED